MLLAVLLLACGAQAMDNTLTPRMAEQGWKLLFNGCSLGNWEFADPKAWVIDDGAICYTHNGGGMIRTRETYKNFTLQIDFRVDKGTNSGVFFRWTNANDPVQTGIEMQVLDSAAKQVPDKHDCGAVYDCLAPSANSMKPAGEWNRCRITCYNNWIDIILNGKHVIHMDLNQWTAAHKNPDGTPNKFNKAYKDMVQPGFIGLQDHGGKVWYKNIYLKEL